MAVFKCKMCGGALEILDETVMECLYCGTKQTLPKLPTERKENLYERAGYFRQNNEFDKAMSIYELVLSEDPTDAESYWSLVLCRYGIEYVQDPASGRRVPTVNRAQYTSVYDDINYKEAINHADPAQRVVYEQEAEAINEIQKGILQISQKEEPFDVFICYKETDAHGRRTMDSVLATDLYNQLTKEGFKVFFSRITLEDKLGVAYEPYIFAALNSSKVMVVVGTKPEYVRAVWVKNEWSRYLAMIRAGEEKYLIPAYKDMDPYELPEEFSHLQAQDMSKLGFMQDLVHGIKKLIGVEERTERYTDTTSRAAIQALIKRIDFSLEDGEWNEAVKHCERLLDIDPECSAAYFGKLMAEYECHTRAELSELKTDLSDNLNYKRILRFGSPDEIAFVEAIKKNMVQPLAGIEVNCPCCDHLYHINDAILQVGHGNCPYCGKELVYHFDDKEESVVVQLVEEGMDVFCPYCDHQYHINDAIVKAGHGNCPYCGKELVYDYDEEDTTQICSECGAQMIITDADYIRGKFRCHSCSAEYVFDEETLDSDVEEYNDHLINCAKCKRDFLINDDISAQGLAICPYCSERLQFKAYGPKFHGGTIRRLRDADLIGQMIDNRRR